ncbi:uncharacterized protein LOC129948356 [Eupeodes corollae]|uniref:uncharacterized protein LOC129948356 n=1 Tax=Eupeodes corollae TaxID=290404 RepID=UPI0024925507|nr:uncharacterized protein LOC129948356 [Eupeodes corollae]
MQKFKNRKQNSNHHNLTKRKEISVPNLTPMQYFEGPDFVCCSEVLIKPKSKLCEGLPGPPQVQEIRCLNKNRPCSVASQWAPETNERDILFRPIRWRCNTRKKRNKKSPEPSLGAPIGLSKSSFGMKYLESKPYDRTLQGFATNLVAFAEYFITPEIEWDEKVLNRILLEGQNLFGESKARMHDGQKLKEASIRRTFTLCGNAFDLFVNEPFMIGQVIGQEAAVPNLHWGLLKFFKKFQFCLLQIDKWYTMLWKNADVFFVFDCFGRRYLDLHSDRNHGVAMLICLRHIENVSHLILNLSGVNPEDFFIIRNIQVKSLIPCGGQPTPDVVDRSVEFEIKSPNYAILRATTHLGSLCFKEIRRRHSLPVAFSALINAKVDPTPTWNKAVLDKIIKLGAHLYKQWTHCDISIDLGIQDVPNRFVFGQFMVEIAVNAMPECGIWRCSPNYQNSELSQALKRSFEEALNQIVQIQGRTYAIWKKGTFYYVLDPYSHQCSLEKKKLRTASLHMCGSFDKMCCIFTQALLELFEESKFIIYNVKILGLEEVTKLKENQYRSQIPCMCTSTQQSDGTEEVKSLNESVLGLDEYVCQAEDSPIESDSADLDSPGLSQTRLEDYSDLRRDFIEESDEETEDEDEDFDLFSGSDRGLFEESDDTDDEDASSRRNKAKEKKTSKKTKKPSDGKKSDKKSAKEKSGSELSDEGIKTKKKKKDKEDKKNKKEKKNKEDKKNKDDDKNTSLKTEEKAEKPEEKKTADKKEVQKETDKNTKNDDKKPKKREKPEEDKNETKSNKRKPLEEKERSHEIAPETPREKPVEQDSPVDEKKSKTEETPSNRNSTEISKSSNAPARRQRNRQRRKQQDGDDSSSADENRRGRLPIGCIPNCYPGFTEDPQNLAVIGSESGSYESLCNLFKSAFRCADRILTMTPWGNYVAFRSNGTFFIFDGCTCNLRSIRHMDLSCGTAGLLCFPDLHSLIKYIKSGKGVRKPTTFSKRDIVDQICSKYCSR